MYFNREKIINCWITNFNHIIFDPNAGIIDKLQRWFISDFSGRFLLYVRFPEVLAF